MPPGATRARLLAGGPATRGSATPTPQRPRDLARPARSPGHPPPTASAQAPRNSRGGATARWIACQTPAHLTRRAHAHRRQRAPARPTHMLGPWKALARAEGRQGARGDDHHGWPQATLFRARAGCVRHTPVSKGCGGRQIRCELVQDGCMRATGCGGDPDEGRSGGGVGSLPVPHGIVKVPGLGHLGLVEPILQRWRGGGQGDQQMRWLPCTQR